MTDLVVGGPLVGEDLVGVADLREALLRLLLLADAESKIVAKFGPTLGP
jgi:hypothetical protein